MKTTYDIGVALAVEDVFTKEAGIREFLRFLGTGRSTAYHGTSKGIAEAVRGGEGLVPGKSRGVAQVFREAGVQDPTGGKNLSFLTRGKGEARNYARQQGFIEGAGTTPPLFGQEAAQEINLLGAGELLPQAKRWWKGYKGARQGAKKGIVEARIPRGAVQRQVNPEPAALRDRLEGGLDNLGVSDNVADILARSGPTKALTNYPFRRTFGVAPKAPGAPALPAKHIVGSPAYQGVTAKEVGQHVGESIRNPRETILEAMRNLSGVERLIS